MKFYSMASDFQISMNNEKLVERSTHNFAQNGIPTTSREIFFISMYFLSVHHNICHNLLKILYAWVWHFQYQTVYVNK